jgi:transcriptional regulator with XRE-family HTH domain
MKLQNLNGFFGYVIQHQRKKLGLSLRQLSRKLGVPHSALSFAEQGKRLAQPEWIDDLATLAGLPVEEMVARAAINYLLTI